MTNRNPYQIGPNQDPGNWLTGECTDWQARDTALLTLAGEVALNSK